jgi:hypothetical protein
MTELIFRPNLIYDLLTLDRKDDSQITDEDYDKHDITEGTFFYEKTGPVPLQEKFPQLLDEIVNFVKLHGFAAHARRRTGTATSCGVTVEDIRQHVIKSVNGLNNISRSKIQNLLQPARQNTKEAARHKDAVDIKVGTKNCDISKENPNSHEYFALVRYLREMSASYTDECAIFSCDSKAKVHIGGQAVSRYHQIRKYFPLSDAPHYADHDFPVPGYLIEPDGYMLLQKKDGCVSEPDKEIKDSLGREIIGIPQTGPLWVYNRCVKQTSTNMCEHINDIRNLLAKYLINKPVITFLTDGGPDWTPKSSVNQFFLGRLWKDEKLDMVISACGPAGLSRFNPIEHAWSSLSRWLAGVQLPACLPGEDKPPSQQNLTTDELTTKENQVFNNALEALNSYWDSKTHDNFRVFSEAINSDYSGYEIFYSDFDTVKKLFNSSLKAIRESEELSEYLDEWKYYVKHMEKRTGMVAFKRGICSMPGDCPCGEELVSAKQVWKLPSSSNWIIPPITPDQDHPGHYKTFSQMKTALSFSKPDEYITHGTHGNCKSCKYVFSSATDEERHNLLIHGGKRNLKLGKERTEQHVCKVCNNTFPTRYQLLKHQDTQGHKLKKGRPTKK